MQPGQSNPREVLRAFDITDERCGCGSDQFVIVAQMADGLSAAFGGAHCRPDDRDGISQQNELCPSEGAHSSKGVHQGEPFGVLAGAIAKIGHDV